MPEPQIEGEVISAKEGIISVNWHEPAYGVVVSTQNETGEEDEVIVVSGKAKLFELDSESKEWKEKGVGMVKLNLCPNEGYSRISKTWSVIDLQLKS